jgi:hypothetical protein
VTVLVPAAPAAKSVVESCTCAAVIASVRAVAFPRPVILKLAMGIFAVMVCVPSFRTAVDNPVAMSLSVLFAHDEAMVVPVTTGLPGVNNENVPAA